MSMKIGVYICECGPNIADKVDIDAIIREIPSMAEFEGVELIVKRFKLLCSNEGQEFLEEEIKSLGLTHLVVAACSPRDHESTFMNICKKTSLNPYLFKMVNIREHCAWIISDKAEATKKATRYIRGGIRRALYQSELMEKALDSKPDVLIVGGGIAGMEAALTLAGERRMVYLVEKAEDLGGKSVLFSKLFPHKGDSTDWVQQKIQDVRQNEQIQVFTKTELESVVGFFGNFEIGLKSTGPNGQQTELKVGAIVAAPGFQLLDPKKLPQYQYKKEDDVYTFLEIESMISREGKIHRRSGEPPKSVALVHCVGRDEKGYCSTVCCGSMIKIAGTIREQLPEVSVKALYRDMCLPHKADQGFYEEIKAQGTEFIRVKDTRLKKNRVAYTGADGAKKEITADMVILAPAMEPAEGTENLANLLSIPLDETGFFQEAHHHLDPVATSTEGIYIVGAAHGPAGIQDSMVQAQAAAGKILTKLIPGEKIVPEVKVSTIIEDFCTGCQSCLEVCCYGAITYDDIKGVSVINEAVCRGCGNCAASCPSGAIRARHFTSPQLYQEMIEAIR
jgi:heterodisulfide reductase subunit A